MEGANMKFVDLRSDTVTQPGEEMRKVMSEAPVGDDVFGEDPTINALEELAANMLGKEAAVFTPSGTMSNLIGVMSHCRRGDEYIVGQQAHTYKYEGGGAAVLGSIQPQPLDFEPDGTLDITKVGRAIKPDDYHFARTRLLCLENTQAGKVLPLAYLADAASFASNHTLKLHIDGARVFNAAVKLGVDVKSISCHCDSISVCLSKGLGAPVGSLLCGSKILIKEARKWRKMLGGGMRQAGILAAAGIYSLQHNISRLGEDHDNASLLAKGLSEIEQVTVDMSSVQTNMVFISLQDGIVARLKEFLKQKGILILGGSSPVRLVTHLNIDRHDIASTIEACKDFFIKR